jgi:tRNA dimethylallyltransferase
MYKKSKPGYDALVITGPTASGKTSLAVAVALKTGGEIISADSRQVYKGMDIGTGKDYSEYRSDGRSIPCHLIDIADAGYKYNVFEYQRDFRRVYDSLVTRNIFPIICGGSGMYIDSIIRGYKMAEVPPDTGFRAQLEKKPMKELANILSSYRRLHNSTDTDSKKRVIRAIEIEHHNTIKSLEQTQFPSLNTLVTGVRIERDERRKRISERLRQRLNEGMVEEVKKLLDNGVSIETLVYYGLEYKFIALFLSGKIGYSEMVKELEISIHQFAKRQMTWFRGMERKGIKIHWISGELTLDEKVKQVLELLEK